MTPEKTVSGICDPGKNCSRGLRPRTIYSHQPPASQRPATSEWQSPDRASQTTLLIVKWTTKLARPRRRLHWRRRHQVTRFERGNSAAKRFEENLSRQCVRRRGRKGKTRRPPVGRAGNDENSRRRPMKPRVCFGNGGDSRVDSPRPWLLSVERRRTPNRWRHPPIGLKLKGTKRRRGQRSPHQSQKPYSQQSRRHDRVAIRANSPKAGISLDLCYPERFCCQSARRSDPGAVSF